MSSPRASFVAAFCGLLLLAAIPSQVFAEKVGAAAAVRPASTGTPPGGSSRTLQVGMDIVERERINTSESGSLQVMFLDKTTLTVGPNSDLLIDQFVYNPGAGTGQFAASLAKGALRFVGGQISHKTGATISTPTATVGIRGGAARIDHGQLCASGECTQVLCSGGGCTVKSLIDARQLTLKVNQFVEIGPLGITPPVTVSTANVNDLATTAVTGEGGEGEGGTGPATFEAAGTINQVIQERDPEPEAPAPPAPGPGPGPPPAP
jgi:hypothetical protein